MSPYLSAPIFAPDRMIIPGGYLPLLKPPIRIDDQAWICADAFVGPGICVGEGAIVAARAVAVKDVGPWEIVAGNPARFIKKRILINY